LTIFYKSSAKDAELKIIYLKVVFGVGVFDAYFDYTTFFTEINQLRKELILFIIYTRVVSVKPAGTFTAK